MTLKENGKQEGVASYAQKKLFIFIAFSLYNFNSNLAVFFAL